MGKENPSDFKRRVFLKRFFFKYWRFNQLSIYFFCFLGPLELLLRGLGFEMIGYQYFLKLKAIKISHKVTRYVVTHSRRHYKQSNMS